MNKRAFVICGPESSGNHLVHSIFANLDFCIPHRYENLERDIKKGKNILVWNGSMPSKLKWYDINAIVDKLKKAGYSVDVIVLSRDWFPMAKSQVKQHPPKNVKEAVFNIRKAYLKIFLDLEKSKTNYIIVNYESLIYNTKECIAGLSSILDYKFNLKLKVENNNSKWYKKDR